MQVPTPSTKNPLQTVSPIWAPFPPHPPQTDWRVQQVIQILTAQLQATHYVKVLADRVNLGPDHLARLFKRETDYTPLQYLKHLRLARAGQLLLTTELRVKEIAAQVGYQDETRLMRDFKTTYGLTPTEYRLRRQSNVAEVGFC